MADVVVSSDNKNSKELLGQGIRAYILQDYVAAVSALSMASELLVTQHGDDLHDSLADVYLYYGKALLGLSREESEALGDAVPKNNDEESDEDEDEAENTETEEGDEKVEATPNGEVKPDEDAKDEKPTEDQKQENGAGSSNGTVKEGEPSASGTKEEADTEDEPTDLQVAWEVLELAKKIYERQGEGSLKNMAETLIVLGEISLESENFEAAVKDIKEGLEIQKKLFGEDSRAVAETYYKLGVAYSTNSQIDEAIKTFEGSLQYLHNRIAVLEKVEDKKDEVEEEIIEITQLIPDLKEKISDMKSYKDETLKEIMSAVTESKTSTENVSSSSSTKPISDISHLVKRKRKLEDVEESGKEDDGNPAKKPPV